MLLKIWKLMNGKIKYTNFGHQKYTTPAIKTGPLFAPKGTILATKYTT